MKMHITREALLDGSLRARQREIEKNNPDLRWRTDAEMAALLDEIMAGYVPGEAFWVFGYGSLIWNPAFEFVERRTAVLRGWHRRFCLKMIVGRGSRENPGLMLGLDRGGACKGVAFRIEPEKIAQEMHILWQREMFGGGYDARWVNLVGLDGTKFRAITFVVRRGHSRYMKDITPEQAAAMIASGAGDVGTSREYLENTVEHLAMLGFKDAGLERIVAALPKIQGPAS